MAEDFWLDLEFKDVLFIYSVSMKTKSGNLKFDNVWPNSQEVRKTFALDRNEFLVVQVYSGR